MKYILLVLVMVMTVTVEAQIRASVYQGMISLVSEDAEGNTPPTANILVTARLYAGGTRRYNWTHEIFVYPLVEYADLKDSKYMRYAIGVGYSFRYLHARGVWYIGDTEVFNVYRLAVSPSFDFGMADRWGVTAMSWSLATTLDYEVVDNWSVSVLGSFTKRPHLEAAYKVSPVVFEVYLGVTYLIN